MGVIDLRLQPKQRHQCNPLTLSLTLNHPPNVTVLGKVCSVFVLGASESVKEHFAFSFWVRKGSLGKLK